jgi:hypothetical protein
MDIVGVLERLPRRYVRILSRVGGTTEEGNPATEKGIRARTRRGFRKEFPNFALADAERPCICVTGWRSILLQGSQYGTNPDANRRELPDH